MAVYDVEGNKMAWLENWLTDEMVGKNYNFKQEAMMCGKVNGMVMSSQPV